MALIPSSGTAAGTKLITKLSYGQALKSRGRNIHVKRSYEFNQNSYPTTYDCLVFKLCRFRVTKGRRSRSYNVQTAN